MRSLFHRCAPRVTAWLLAPALGVALRLVPASTSPDNTWVADAAAHYRLVASLVEHRRLPDPDPLTDLPQGRHLGRFLPLGLYASAAAWHRAATWVGGRDLGWSLAWFTALAGALVAWPAWIGARAIGAGPWGSALAGLLAVVLPAHLQRTTAFMLRYDALGVDLVAAHALFGIAALAAPTRRGALVRSALSGLGLIGALAVWRVPLIVPAVEAAAVAAVAIVRPPSARLRIWMASTAVALVAACVAFEYLRAQWHIFSISTTVVVAVAAVLQMRISRDPGSRPASRGAAILMAGATAMALSVWLGQRGDFEALVRLLRVRLLGPMGLGGTTDPMTAVLLSVKELGPMSLSGLWGPSAFSWPGLWLLASPAALWWRSGQPLRRWARGADEALAVLLGVSGALSVLSLLAMRHRILLAPLVASLLGACVSAFANEGRGGASAEPTGGTGSEAAAAPSQKGPRGRRRRTGGSGTPPRSPTGRVRLVQSVALVAFVACLAMLLRDAWSATVKSVTGLDLGMPATIAYLREHAGHGPVLSFWDRGYELQRYAGCATVTDGLLESEVNQDHIVATARAFMAPTPDSLEALCDRFGVEFVVVPPSWYIRGVAIAAGDPLADKLAAQLPLSPQDLDRVVTRMMLVGKAEPPFVPVFERGHYRIYRRVAPQPPGPTTNP